jgi:hypothetical protein
VRKKEIFWRKNVFRFVKKSFGWKDFRPKTFVLMSAAKVSPVPAQS